MDQEFSLKNLAFRRTEDGKYLSLDCTGLDGETAKIVVPTEEFDQLIAVMIEYSTQLKIGDALPVQNPQTELPAQDHALLVATDVNVVRFEAGGTVLQFQTSLGAALQIGLDEKQTAFLRSALSSITPPGLAN